MKKEYILGLIVLLVIVVGMLVIKGRGKNLRESRPYATTSETVADDSETVDDSEAMEDDSKDQDSVEDSSADDIDSDVQEIENLMDKASQPDDIDFSE